MLLQNRNENGFTLIEVLVSMVIFAVGILAVINMQLISSWTNTKSRHMTEGVVLAQGKIEELMGLSYSDGQLSDSDNDGETNNAIITDPSLDDIGADADFEDNSNPFYTLYWNVREDYPYDNTKTVRVVVRWDEKELPKSFSLDMVKTRKDI